MTVQDNTPPESENPEATPDDESQTDNMAGFTDITGPAAFKAKMKQQNTAQTEESDPLAPEPLSSYEQAAPHAGPIDTGKVAELEKALAESKDQLIRTVADMDNLRKRAAREREDASKYAVSSFARDLLDVSDTFRRALDSMPEDLRADERAAPLIQGIEAMERVLLGVFEKNGIQKIEPMDEIFNPNFHEVMFEAPVADKPNGTIIQIIEPGYMLHDRLLRPARVGVAKTTGADDAHNVDTQA